MHARAAAAARARNAAAAAHTGPLQVLQIQRTPEELAADAREEKQDMLSSGAQSQQAAQARARNRALQEKEKQQRLEADKAAKLAKKRAANRERMQRLRCLSRAGGMLLLHGAVDAYLFCMTKTVCACPCCFVSECGEA